MGLKTNIKYNGVTKGTIDGNFSINYNGSLLTSITTSGTRTLNCAGKLMSNNIILEELTEYDYTQTGSELLLRNAPYTQTGAELQIN